MISTTALSVVFAARQCQRLASQNRGVASIVFPYFDFR